MKIFYVEDNSRIIIENLRSTFGSLAKSGVGKRLAEAEKLLTDPDVWDPLEELLGYLDQYGDIVIRRDFPSALQWLIDNKTRLDEFEMFVFDRNLREADTNYKFDQINAIDDLYDSGKHKYVTDEHFGREGDYLLWRTSLLLKELSGARQDLSNRLFIFSGNTDGDIFGVDENDLRKKCSIFAEMLANGEFSKDNYIAKDDDNAKEKLQKRISASDNKRRILAEYGSILDSLDISIQKDIVELLDKLQTKMTQKEISEALKRIGEYYDSTFKSKIKTRHSEAEAAASSEKSWIEKAEIISDWYCNNPGSSQYIKTMGDFVYGCRNAAEHFKDNVFSELTLQAQIIAFLNIVQYFKDTGL